MDYIGPKSEHWLSCHNKISMIDRYSITAPSLAIKERFNAEVLDTYVPKFNAAPTHLLPVITLGASQGVSSFYWGTTPAWSKNKALSEKIINVRAETIIEKSAFRKAIQKSRCIVPADGFYAWKKVGKKTSVPYRFLADDQELFSFAGLWEEFEDTEGTEWHTFSIITTQSNQVVAEVQERMPVIFSPESEKIWMSKDTDIATLIELLKPYQSKMSYYPVSPRINDSRVNTPSLISPTPPADQFGNLTLFD
jgi:putative SOS response-associated peptidase YedK